MSSLSNLIWKLTVILVYSIKNLTKWRRNFSPNWGYYTLKLPSLPPALQSLLIQQLLIIIFSEVAPSDWQSCSASNLSTEAKSEAQFPPFDFLPQHTCLYSLKGRLKTIFPEQESEKFSSFINQRVPLNHSVRVSGSRSMQHTLFAYFLWM